MAKLNFNVTRKELLVSVKSKKSGKGADKEFQEIRGAKVVESRCKNSNEACKNFIAKNSDI